MDEKLIEPVKEIINIFGNNYPLEFLLRLLLDMLVTLIIVRVIYYPRHKNKDFVFTFILFNLLIFLICFLLSGAKIKTGFAFGLFAIFSILRYRTVVVPIREMGYFFVTVSIGLINALVVLDVYSNLYVLICSNLLIMGIIYFLDRQLSLDHENFKTINYERVDLIHPDQREMMIADLQKRTGLNIHRIEILKIDFLRDIARINAFYYSKENESRFGSSDDDD